MNLNDNPTRDQLRDLLRACDDRAGHHVLWVDRGGEVRITRVPKDRPADGFEDIPGAHLQFVTLEGGHDLVGPGAADDAFWVADLFTDLVEEWAEAKGKSEAVYVDQF